jgi:hypothetical protein
MKTTDIQGAWDNIHNGYMRGVCTGGGIIYQHLMGLVKWDRNRKGSTRFPWAFILWEIFYVQQEQELQG